MEKIKTFYFPGSLSLFLPLYLSPFILVLSHCALFPSLFFPLPKVLEHIVGPHSLPLPLRLPSTLSCLPRLPLQSQTAHLIHIFPLSTPLLLLSRFPLSFPFLHNTASVLICVCITRIQHIFASFYSVLYRILYIFVYLFVLFIYFCLVCSAFRFYIYLFMKVLFS